MSSGDRVAQIEMLYQQKVTVQIPVDEVPTSPEAAFDVVKNRDPEYVADVMPTRWGDAMTQGDLQVLDIDDVTESVRP